MERDQVGRLSTRDERNDGDRYCTKACGVLQAQRVTQADGDHDREPIQREVLMPPVGGCPADEAANCGPDETLDGGSPRRVARGIEHDHGCNGGPVWLAQRGNEAGGREGGCGHQARADAMGNRAAPGRPPSLCGPTGHWLHHRVRYSAAGRLSASTESHEGGLTASLVYGCVGKQRRVPCSRRHWPGVTPTRRWKVRVNAAWSLKPE